jgi:hypothetical protein
VTIQKLIEGLQQLTPAQRELEAVVRTQEAGEVSLTVEVTDVEITGQSVIIIGDLDQV